MFSNFDTCYFSKTNVDYLDFKRRFTLCLLTNDITFNTVFISENISIKPRGLVSKI